MASGIAPGARRDERSVPFTAALAADLQSLSETFDGPEVDLSHTLARLASAAASAFDSYLGLCLTAGGNGLPAQLNTLPETVQVIGSSLQIPVTRIAAGATRPSETTTVVIVLYAATPGAFTDFAADLAWMTGRSLDDFRLDQDLTPPTSPLMSALGASSLINQAIGVLIGRGSTLEQARHYLASQAAAGRVDLATAAAAVLANLDG